MPLNKKSIKAAVIGGDARQIFIANELADMGYAVSVFALGGSYIGRLSSTVVLEKKLNDTLYGAFLAICPIPFSRDSLTLNAPYYPSKINTDSLISTLCECKVVAAGMLSDSARASLSEKTFVIDYAKNEDFLLKNAFASAEGALSVIIESMPTTLCSSVCAITGYGRISRALASYLRSLGAKVKIFARKECDRTDARLHGLEAHEIGALTTELSDIDVLINTVPSVIICKEALASLPKDAILIELASRPGGFDKEAKDKLGKEIISAEALPARFSPKSAGRAVVESIFSSLEKEALVW